MILDIILVALALLVLFVGFKVGFFRSFLKLASVFAGLILAIALVSPTTKLVLDLGAGDQMTASFQTKITESQIYQEYYDAGGGEEGAAGVLNSIGIPKLFANMLAKVVVNGNEDSSNMDEFALNIAKGLTKIIMSIIVFLSLMVLSSLVILILKHTFTTIRDGVFLIRLIDGILGMAFFAVIFLIILYVFLLIVSKNITATNGFMNWMNEQLHLGDDKFGIAKYFYNNNIVGNIFGIIF